MVNSIKHKVIKCGFLAELNEDLCDKLVQVGSFTSKKKGEYLAVQGQPHSRMSLIISGHVSVKISANGESLKVAKLKSGDVVGEMSIIDPKKASATARIISSDAELWQINGEDFNNFLLADREGGFEIMRELAKMLCKRLRTYNERMLHSMYDERDHYLEQDY
jgi:CRP-like cAMP-binding protein